MMVIQSTPSPRAMQDSPSRIRSQRPWRDKLRTTFRGIKLGVRGHSSFSVHFFFTVLVLAAAIVLHCDLVQWCLLLGCIGMVLIAELFNSALVTLFRGLEQYPELLTDPRSLRDGYLEQIQSFVADLQRNCLSQNIDYVQMRTDTQLGIVLSSYLAHRLARSSHH